MSQYRKTEYAVLSSDGRMFLITSDHSWARFMAIVVNGDIVCL